MKYIVLLVRLLPLQLHINKRIGKARIKGENHDLKIQDLVNNLTNNKIALALALALALPLAHLLTAQNATSVEEEDISNVIAKSI
jgi:hypothetical protein